MKAFKVAAISGLAVASVFGGVSLVFYFGDWVRFGFTFFAGLFVGLIAAPEFEPKSFKRAWLFQTCCGALSGLMVAITFSLSSEATVLALVVGGFLGWSAPAWIKYVPIQ